ncbi:FAD-binding molybdopterin dehydrogenase [Bradyrhizobium sp. 83012]|uniref:FAD-binding molybdopterin dehydrogenase n=1 Tax=Bradyrhizobium aeschynomenes TaxID=2734909 RepID=A0ABX2CG29_9BRAD|nr:FAD binding domain-containing protein [Bradyrhizobium aeschynomenes]NPU67154.1 FAD-binding molybdopterin dehydrogenase [Bradyrhizobium aeschynomenes]
MDLNTITEVVRPTTRAGLPAWKAGDAWLAGGTWLFSEPQVQLSRLIDLREMAWPALTTNDQGLCIAATCSVAELDALPCPPDWIAAPLIDQCCRAFLASFKIWKTATVGGNLCMSLPAGPMISLLAALEGVCTIWKNDGREQRVAVTDFVTGNNSNLLAPGDLLRQIDVSLAALQRRTAFRQIALTPVGRSGALLIGTIGRDRDLLLTVTASTTKPLQLRFTSMPDAALLHARILRDIPDVLYHDDVHGNPVWRKAMTLRLAEEIRAELAGIRP